MSQIGRILVIDDDADLREILRVILENSGYAVSQAASGPQGLEAVDREHPDLILLDVMMPEGTEGFHLVWKLRGRSDDYARTVPIVILTAIHQKTALRFYPDVGDGTYEPGEYLPVQGFVDKPVHPDALLQEVNRVLQTEGGDRPPP